MAPRPLWMENWISLQRGFLAGILVSQGAGRGLMEHQPDPPTKDASQPSTHGDPDTSSSRTRRKSKTKDATECYRTWLPADTLSATERLPLPKLGRLIGGSVGSCSELGPTLLASDGPKGGPNGRGAKGDPKLPAWCAKLLPTLVSRDYKGPPSGKYQKGSLAREWREFIRSEAVRLLPTLCATDHKSPYSEAGYQKQSERRSKPLRDTAAHTIGIRLTPTFCEWWMGWPIGSTAGGVLKPSAMHGSRSKRRRPGVSLEDRNTYDTGPAPEQERERG